MNYVTNTCPDSRLYRQVDNFWFSRRSGASDKLKTPSGDERYGPASERVGGAPNRNSEYDHF
jgi:hypothetical protein